MAIAHVCVQCGWDLARTRASREPHYGLWLVRCPRCQNACVRQRHPISAAWRRSLRLKASLIALLSHAFVLLMLTIFTFIAMSFSLGLQGWTFDEVRHEYPAEIILSFLVVPTVTGTWLTAGLRHVRRWKIWIGWTMFIAALASIETVVHGIGRVFGIQYYISDAPERMMREWFWNMRTLAVMMTIALAGMPLGWKLLNAYAHHRRHHWRKRRRKRRSQRSFA